MSDPAPLGLFYSRVRPEEQALRAAAERRGVALDLLHDEAVTFGLAPDRPYPAVVLNRSISHTQALYAARFFDHYGLVGVNGPSVLEVCGDKVLASLRLQERGIPTPRTTVALTPAAALRAVEAVGYPAVLKPPIGSWGRLLAKVGSREEAEQVIEHKAALASPTHSVFYVQEYVPKPQRDLRAFVAGEEFVAGMYRYSDAWRTNAARGGRAEPLPKAPAVEELALRAAEAVGGGVLAVDLMESPHGLVVHEVNPTPEFKALQAATGVDVADRVLSYALGAARR